MKLDPNETVAGIPIVRIRSFLRKIHQQRWPADAVEAAFPAKGEEVFEGLIENGYVTATSEPGIYKTTLKGDLLVEATVPSPAPRTKHQRKWLEQ